MSDRVIHALAFDDQVRVIVADTRNTVQQAVNIHQTAATASAALGRVLTVARMVQATVKADERVTLQIQGGGPLGVVLGRALPGGAVYGTVGAPGVHLPPRPDGKLDVGSAVGRDGKLMVTRDRAGTRGYSGTTELVSGEIGDDIAQYLATSEQIRSAVGVGVLMKAEGVVQSAGGFLLQILGDVDPDRLPALEARVLALADVSRNLDEGGGAESLLDVLSGGDHRILAESDIRYHCPKDRDYYLGRLAALDRDDMDGVFEGDDSIALTCEFTRREHTFTREEVQALRSDAEQTAHDQPN